MMSLSHIILRYKEPELVRPYRTPGGRFNVGIDTCFIISGTGFHVFGEFICGSLGRYFLFYHVALFHFLQSKSFSVIGARRGI